MSSTLSVMSPEDISSKAMEPVLSVKNLEVIFSGFKALQGMPPALTQDLN